MLGVEPVADRLRPPPRVPRDEVGPRAGPPARRGAASPRPRRGLPRGARRDRRGARRRPRRHRHTGRTARSGAASSSAATSSRSSGSRTSSPCRCPAARPRSGSRGGWPPPISSGPDGRCRSSAGRSCARASRSTRRCPRVPGACSTPWRRSSALRETVSYEGQAAIELEQLAGDTAAAPYACSVARRRDPRRRPRRGRVRRPGGGPAAHRDRGGVPRGRRGRVRRGLRRGRAARDGRPLGRQLPEPAPARLAPRPAGGGGLPRPLAPSRSAERRRRQLRSGCRRSRNAWSLVMCLGIPGQVIEVVDRDAGLAKVDISGVRREVSVALVDEPAAPIEVGDWVLIHVGFALARIDEDDARETLALLAARRRAAAGARRAAPGNRVTGLAPERCITCSDEAVEAEVVAVDGLEAIVLVAGSEERVAVDLVPDADPGGCAPLSRGDRAGAARAVHEPASGSGHKAEVPAGGSAHEVRRRVPLGRAGAGARLGDRGARDARRDLARDGGLRRPHARHLPPRPRGPAAARGRARARARLPGLRDPDGARRRRDRDRRGAGCHPGHVRRHDARARRARVAARGEGPRGRRAHGLLAARRARARREAARPARRLLRDRLRDDRARDRGDAAAGASAGDAELRRLLQPRHDRAAAARDPRDARAAGRRVHRARSRLHGDRHRRLPLHPGGVRPPRCRLRLRAGRPAAVDRDAAAPARRGPLRGREPVHPRRAPRGQRPRARGDRRDDGAARRLRVARPRHDPAERDARAPRVRRLGRGGAVHDARACASRTRRPAAVARC